MSMRLEGAIRVGGRLMDARRIEVKVLAADMNANNGITMPDHERFRVSQVLTDLDERRGNMISGAAGFPALNIAWWITFRVQAGTSTQDGSDVSTNNSISVYYLSVMTLYLYFVR